MNDRKIPTTYHSISTADARDGRGDGVFAVGYLISLPRPQFLHFLYIRGSRSGINAQCSGRKEGRIRCTQMMARRMRGSGPSSNRICIILDSLLVWSNYDVREGGRPLPSTYSVTTEEPHAQSKRSHGQILEPDLNPNLDNNCPRSEMPACP